MPVNRKNAQPSGLRRSLKTTRILPHGEARRRSLNAPPWNTPDLGRVPEPIGRSKPAGGNNAMKTADTPGFEPSFVPRGSQWNGRAADRFPISNAARRRVHIHFTEAAHYGTTNSRKCPSVGRIRNLGDEPQIARRSADKSPSGYLRSSAERTPRLPEYHSASVPGSRAAVHPRIHCRPIVPEWRPQKFVCL